MVKLYGFSLSVAYCIARRRHPYVESLPTLWYTANLVWLMISTSVSAHLALITALRFTHAINTNPLGMINFKFNTTSQVLSTTCIFSWIITEPAQKPLCNQKLLPNNIPFLIPSNHTFQLTPFAPIILACKYWSIYIYLYKQRYMRICQRQTMSNFAHHITGVVISYLASLLDRK